MRKDKLCFKRGTKIIGVYVCRDNLYLISVRISEGGVASHLLSRHCAVLMLKKAKENKNNFEEI